MAEIAQYEAPYNEAAEQEKLKKAVQCNANATIHVYPKNSNNMVSDRSRITARCLRTIR